MKYDYEIVTIMKIQ